MREMPSVTILQRMNRHAPVRLDADEGGSKRPGQRWHNLPMRSFQLAGFVLLAAIGLFAQAAPVEGSIYIDDNGIMRWTSSGKEIALLGVNYAVPFAHGYRAIGYVGANHETTDRKSTR